MPFTCVNSHHCSWRQNRGLLSELVATGSNRCQPSPFAPHRNRALDASCCSTVANDQSVRLTDINLILTQSVTSRKIQGGLTGAGILSTHKPRKSFVTHSHKFLSGLQLPVSFLDGSEVSV